jgi:hypothetical protein
MAHKRFKSAFRRVPKNWSHLAGTASLMLIALAVLATPVLAQERLAHALGEIEYLASPTGVLIAAPHGTYDANTAPLAIAVARKLGAGYVVARRFTVDGTRINVNRATEGANLTCQREFRTSRAQEIYGLYSQTVSTAAQNRPLRLYVEIHGNSEPRTSQTIEIATTAISRTEARSVSDAYPDMLGRARKQMPAYPEVGLLIEPLNRVYFEAACAKSIGIFSKDFVPRVMHFELPRSARTNEAQEATAALIAEIVSKLLAGP